MKHFIFFIQISLKFVPEGQTDNKWSLVHDKPLPKPMITKFYDAIHHHLLCNYFQGQKGLTNLNQYIHNNVNFMMSVFFLEIHYIVGSNLFVCISMASKTAVTPVL